MSTALLVLRLLFVCPVVIAAPGRNITALNVQYARPFVPEPDGRGTWGLLYSCVFTLVLCVWTAIHPNLPSLRASKSQKYWLKILWVLMAVFAPEIGVLTAFRQYQKATGLASQLSRLRSTSIDDPKRLKDMNPQEREHSNRSVLGESARTDLESGPLSPAVFSKSYGFYVLMGGLSLNVSHLHDRLKYVLLTHNGVLYLARKGIFFDVSDEDIHDKSKANTLAKGLVLLQITWTILQCLSRKAVGLPLSILEVHILVHAGCALIMYTLWFNKPLDVDTPTRVTARVPDETLALMLMQTHKLGHRPYGNYMPSNDFDAVRLSSSRSGVWPPSHAAESTYLIFDPQAATNSANSDITPITIRIRHDPGVCGRDLDLPPSLDSESMSQSRSQVSNTSSQANPPSSKPTFRPSIIPPSGTEKKATVVTGECLTAGIGPNAYALGKWRRRPPHVDSDHVERLPIYLQKELPLNHIDPLTVEYYCPLTISLSQKDVRRWQLAGAALQGETTSRSLCRFDSSGGSAQGSYFITDQSLLGLAEGFMGGLLDTFGGAPKDFMQHVILLRRMYEGFVSSISALTLLPGLMYGGLHLALWNSTFPSFAERLLWRVSGIVLFAVPVLMSLIVAHRMLYGRVFARDCALQVPDQLAMDQNAACSESTSPASPVVRVSTREIIFINALYGFSALVGILYIFARVYVIVESFISLRHVPVGVYSDVGWSKYIPHL
ncbi:MAG: hypothetical protein Q9222_004826 [Ikaeria aurantiellina]